MDRTISRSRGKRSIAGMVPQLQLLEEDEDVLAEGIENAQNPFGFGFVIRVGGDIADFPIQEEAFRIDEEPRKAG
jgi:hypothetical protein